MTAATDSPQLLQLQRRMIDRHCRRIHSENPQRQGGKREMKNWRERVCWCWCVCFCTWRQELRMTHFGADIIIMRRWNRWGNSINESQQVSFFLPASWQSRWGGWRCPVPVSPLQFKTKTKEFRQLFDMCLFLITRAVCYTPGRDFLAFIFFLAVCKYELYLLLSGLTEWFNSATTTKGNPGKVKDRFLQANTLLIAYLWYSGRTTPSRSPLHFLQ